MAGNLLRVMRVLGSIRLDCESFAHRRASLRHVADATARPSTPQRACLASQRAPHGERRRRRLTSRNLSRMFAPLRPKTGDDARHPRPVDQRTTRRGVVPPTPTMDIGAALCAPSCMIVPAFSPPSHVPRGRARARQALGATPRTARRCRSDSVPWGEAHRASMIGARVVKDRRLAKIEFGEALMPREWSSSARSVV